MNNGTVSRHGAQDAITPVRDPGKERRPQPEPPTSACSNSIPWAWALSLLRVSVGHLPGASSPPRHVGMAGSLEPDTCAESQPSQPSVWVRRRPGLPHPSLPGELLPAQSSRTCGRAASALTQTRTRTRGVQPQALSFRASSGITTHGSQWTRRSRAGARRAETLPEGPGSS